MRTYGKCDICDEEAMFAYTMPLGEKRKYHNVCDNCALQAIREYYFRIIKALKP